MSKRDLLAITDLTRAEATALLARAETLRAATDPGHRPQPLAGKTLAMVFEKASTRTRVSFEVGCHQLGGHAVLLEPRGTQIGRGESIHDTANVLGRYCDGIMVRTFAHNTIEEWARYAPVPVINGLTDLLHPCQVLADLLTCRQAFGAEALTELAVAWIGDGNNMAHSWINAAAVFGFALRLACPAEYSPDPAILAAAQARGARVEVLRAPMEAVAGATVVTTDVWASMGQEEESRTRRRAFAGYQVNEALMAAADPRAIFLHCLPAHRGEEVTAEVIDGPQARVFDEAHNRLHVQKALMEWMLGGRPLDL